MSYARWGPESDVYVYLDVHGYLNCCGCALDHDGRFYTTAETIDHLAEHVRAGQDVPDHCIGRLMQDAIENDRWIADFGGPRDG